MNRTESAEDLLRAFSRGIIRESMNGCWFDGADIQELGVKYGLLKEVTVTEPCGEMCACAEVSDFPLTCYRMTEILTND